jgi:hypothetical protein
LEDFGLMGLDSAIGWSQYYVFILLDGISGRDKALQIEGEYINAYREKYGRNPHENIEKQT